MKRAVIIPIILCSLLCGLPAHAAGPADRSPWAAEEAAKLQAIARDPAGPLLLLLEDGASFPGNRVHFDQAVAACRQTLKENPGNTAVRANLGGLYLLRDNFHPEESGGYSKAVDQFLIALRDDPANGTALAYLGTYEVSSRLTTLLSRETVAAVETALNRSLEKYPRNPAVLHTVARFHISLGRMADALPLAHALADVAPEQFSSHLLVGALELKTGGHERARTAFETALAHAADDTDKATARLGLAQLLQELGRLDAAAAALDDAAQLVPRERLERSARAASIPSPGEVGWAVGKALAKRGDTAKAIDYMTIKDINWLSSMQAAEKNGEGVALYDAKDLAGARRAFIAAVQLLPLDATYWRNLAHTSYEMGRYRESVTAFGKAGSKEPLRTNEVHRMAIASAVLGDYRSARELEEKGARDFSDNEGLKSWAVVMAYGVGGWEEALETWSRLFHRQAQRSNADLYQVFNLCQGGVRDISSRAETLGMRYQSLRQESLLYRILGEGLSRRLLSDAGRKEVKKEREAVFDKIADNYRHLPLKPVLPSEAKELAHQAKTSLDANDWSTAVERYKQASEMAPWWPDGRYILALLASHYPSGYTFDKYDTYERKSGRYPYAVEEMNAYLALDPNGPESRKARKRMEGWQAEGPWSRPGKDVE